MEFPVFALEELDCERSLFPFRKVEGNEEAIERRASRFNAAGDQLRSLTCSFSSTFPERKERLLVVYGRTQSDRDFSHKFLLFNRKYFLILSVQKQEHQQQDRRHLVALHLRDMGQH